MLKKNLMIISSILLGAIPIAGAWGALEGVKVSEKRAISRGSPSQKSPPPGCQEEKYFQRTFELIASQTPSKKDLLYKTLETTWFTLDRLIEKAVSDLEVNIGAPPTLVISENPKEFMKSIEKTQQHAQGAACEIDFHLSKALELMGDCQKSTEKEMMDKSLNTAKKRVQGFIANGAVQEESLMLQVFDTRPPPPLVTDKDSLEKILQSEKEDLDKDSRAIKEYFENMGQLQEEPLLSRASRDTKLARRAEFYLSRVFEAKKLVENMRSHMPRIPPKYFRKMPICGDPPKEAQSEKSLDGDTQK